VVQPNGPNFKRDGNLVTWYTASFTHETLGFKLRPDGFFDENPALDVPAGQVHPSRRGGVPLNVAARRHARGRWRQSHRAAR
jgi:hypothetical protein